MRWHGEHRGPAELRRVAVLSRGHERRQSHPSQRARGPSSWQRGPNGHSVAGRSRRKYFGQEWSPNQNPWTETKASARAASVIEIGPVQKPRMMRRQLGMDPNKSSMSAIARTKCSFGTGLDYLPGGFGEWEKQASCGIEDAGVHLSGQLARSAPLSNSGHCGASHFLDCTRPAAG
jgi:hypothetical protein